MRNLKRRFERFTAIALAVLMVVTTVDLSTFAVSAAGEGSGTYCEHHAEHTSECGYTEGIEGSPCTHEHGEECYSEVTVCVHGHDESCGYVEGVEDSCTHICSLDNGCIISALNCTHEHDEACGYQAAVEGTPCIFECEECADASNAGSDTVSGNEVSEETTECTCETDDPAFHATNCPAYIAPENPQCTCAEKCTEDTLNVWCDVCGMQGVSACQGEDIAVTYDAETPDFSTAKVLTAVDGALCIDGDSVSTMPAGNYKLTGDIATDTYIRTEGSINLDLNGYTWDMSAKYLFLNENVTLSLYDTSVNKTGKITSSSFHTIYLNGSGSTFNLYSGTVENTSDNVNAYGVSSDNGSSNLYGGTIESNAYAVFYYLGQNITINIDNTSFDCGAGYAQICTFLASNEEPCAVIDVSDYTGGVLTVDAKINEAAVIKFFTGIQSAQDAENYKVNVSCDDNNKDFFMEKEEYEEDGGNKYVYVSVPSFTTQPTEENDYTVAFNHPDATLQWCEVTVLKSATHTEENRIPEVVYEVNAGDALIVSLSECSDDFCVDFDCIYNEESLYMSLDSSRKTASVTFDSEGTVDVNCMPSPYGTGEYKIEHVRYTELEGENGFQLGKTECETTYVCKATVGETVYYSDEVTIEQEHSYTCTATSDNVITKECANCGKSGTLTITAEGGIYDGTTAYGATVIKTGIFENEEVTVKYYQGDTFIGTDAPVDVGTYTAKITYEGVTASVTYTINTTPTADMFTYIESAVYDGTVKSADVTVKDGITGIGEITNIKYYQNDIEVTPVNAGTYTVKIDVADGDIYDAATDIEVGTFEITKATPTAEMFTATPSSELVYDGTEKSIIVTTDKVGMGTFTVSYISVTDSTQPVEPVEAGLYIVLLHIEEGDNYIADDTLSFVPFEIRKADSVITAAPTPIADLVYGGTAQNLINAGTATGGEMQYSLDGTNYSSAIPTGTDAKTYTVWYKVVGDENHNDTEPESIEVLIAKVTPDIGTVSAADMENTLDVSEVVLSRSNETVPGTLSLAEGTTLQYGIHDYTYVFKSGDANYNDVEGTVSITIKDTNAPTATYKVGTDGWKQFINTITFGHFCKDYTTVDITYSDEGSGVADKQYYISDVEITNTENIQWSEYTDTLNINATGKYYIYVRVTDNYGNVVIQNSEGIVVYAESVITPTSFSCEYGEENDLFVNITTNGNTFANLTDGSGNEIATENYSIDGSTLTIKGEYLSDLDVGEYTYKICMNPQGVENTEVTLAYSFVVKVTAKELTVTGATATSRDYIANDKTVDITGVTLSGKQGTDDVSVEITGLKGTLSSANAGTYTSVTLPTLTLTGDDAENYVLVLPTSAVATNVTINKLNPTITVDETEYYKTFGDADFTLDITDDNPEANVTYSSNDENVVTVSNGTVTIKGAGLTTITVSMGASTNYNAAVDKTVTVNVARAAYSVDTINKSYLYARSNADSINLAELLPEDCGTVYYASVTYNGALTFTSEDTKPKVTNGILAYTLESGAADDTGNIVVVVETQNYEDITITVNVTLIDKIPVNVDGEVELNSNVLTYGETLSRLTFKSVDFVDNAGNEVEGTLAWKEPSATPNAGTTSATWVFTPNNAEYASVEGTVAITVNKATPNVTGVPTVADRVYNPSVVLADSVLTGGTVKGVDGNSLAGSWSWQSTNVVPVVNNSGYIAVFTPTDSTNYETVTRTITVNVTKATPYVATKPTASALTYGQTLNQSVLSNGVIHYSETDSTVVAGSFAWENGTVKPAVSDSATTLYNVLFTPDDSDNYKEVTVKLTVSVSKAEATALNNANKTYVYAESKNGESVSIEGLPEDCGSVSYEISSISDTNNMLENVSVDATGKLTYDVKSLNAYSNGLYATVTVTVSMQNYEDLTYTLTVVRTDKLVQNISAENISLTFGDNDTDIVVTGNKTELSYRVVDDSNENGDVVTVDSTGKVHIVNSGTATVEIKAEGSSSYAEAFCEIQVTVAKRTVNVPAKDDTVYTYTGLPQTYSIASSPFYTIENTTQTNAGTYDVAVSLISDNYQWSAVLPEYKFVIKPAQVTITAESHTVKQGDELPAFTYITTGLVNGENLPITVSVTCSATNSETVGTYDIVVSGPANEGNYTYTYKKGTLEVLAEDNAPFIMGDDGKMGWDAISDEIEDANKGDTIVVDMNGATVVPGDIIEEARDKGITISFVLDNGLTWTIDGSTVTDGDISNINFDTTVEDENNPLNNIPVDVINGVTGEKATIEVNLTYSGNFGLTAVLKANLGSDNAGYYANLYYYNPTTGKLEYMCADVIASNGEAKLTFTHASDYLIVIDDEDLGKAPDDDDGDDNDDDDNTTEDKDDGKDEVPDTGDDGTLYLWVLMLCALIGMAGVTYYEKLLGKKK